MKAYWLIIFLLMMPIVPCSAQTTGYQHEIAVREQRVQSFNQRIHDLEMRKTTLLRTESEYNLLMESKRYVDRKVEAVRSTDQVQGRERKSGVFTRRPYGNVQDRLTKELGLSILSDQATIANYTELERWIAVYDKMLPQNRLELENIDRDLQKVRSDLEMAEKEIAALKIQEGGGVTGRSVIEGRWLLRAGRGRNVIDVYYDGKKGFFYGKVIENADLVCHAQGSFIFTVRQSQRSNDEFHGTEYGFEYDRATGKCQPQKAEVSITVTQARMIYYNGSEQLFFDRLPK